MSVPGTVVSSFPLENALGSLLIGGLVASALWGVTCIQTLEYFMHGINDSLLSKLLIGFLWCLDTFDSCLTGHILFFYTVINALNPLADAVHLWSVNLHVATTTISNFIVRSLFTRRLLGLSKSNIVLTTFVVVVSLLDMVCGLIITAELFASKSYFGQDKLSALVYLSFAAGTLADAVLALALCFYLHRSRVESSRTNSIITLLMVYIINTGAIVVLDATIVLITYVTMPHSLVFFSFYLLLSKLYLNAYLATLNARQCLRSRSQATDFSGINFTSVDSTATQALAKTQRHGAQSPPVMKPPEQGDIP